MIIRTLPGLALAIVQPAATAPPHLEEPVWLADTLYDEVPPPAREPAELLRAIESLGDRPAAPEPGSPAQAFDDWRLVCERHAVDRAGLIGGLQRAGYTGPEMPGLLIKRAEDAAYVLEATYKPMNLWSGVLWELADAHKGEAIAAVAELASKAMSLRVMSFEGLAVSQASLERIADLELAAMPVLPAERSGYVLARAMVHQPPEVIERWRAWMIEHLPVASRARAWAETQRRFGSPYRAVGTGFGGEAVDTAAWAGDVVLIDFWGTWCGWCIVEMPEIAAYRERYAERGFRVLGVSFDEPERSRRWLAERPEFDWPQIAGFLKDPEKPASYGNRIVEELGISGFPTYLLIDRAGQLHPGGRGDELRAAIERLLAEPRPEAP